MVAVIAGVAVLAVAVVFLSVPIDRLAYVAVAVFVLLITWNGLRLGGGAVANGFMVVAFAAVLGQTVVARRPLPLPPWLLAAGGGFVLAAMLNVIFPPQSGLINQTLLQYRTLFQPPPTGFLVPQSDFALLIKLEIALVIVPVMLMAVATTVKRVDRLIDMFVLSATVNAAVALVDFAGLRIAPMPAYSGREFGLTVHPNYLALTCTIGIPLALLWVNRGGRWRSAGLIATALLLGGEYVSGSRVGAVTAVLALVVTIALLPRLRRALGFVLPIVGMVVVALLVLTKAGNQVLDQVRLSGSSSTSGSDASRSQLASLAIKQFQARPLQGVGISVIENAHDIYLQLLAAAGVIGLAAFLTYVGGLWDAARRALAGPQRDAAAAAGVAVGFWLINGVFDNQLADKYLYVIPGLLLAMSCVARAAVRDRSASTAPHAATPARPSLAQG